MSEHVGIIKFRFLKTCEDTITIITIYSCELINYFLFASLTIVFYLPPAMLCSGGRPLSLNDDKDKFLENNMDLQGAPLNSHCC